MNINKNHSQSKLSLIIVSLIIVWIISSCNLPYYTNPLTAYPDGIIKDYQPQIKISGYARYTLSADQLERITSYGYPQRFMLTFLSKNYGNSVRHESWYYDAFGISIDFFNGEELNETAIVVDNTLAEIKSTRYKPEDFTAKMNLDQIISLSGDNGFYLETLDNDLIQNGKLVFLQGLSLTFLDGQLTTVETLPIGNAGIPLN